MPQETWAQIPEFPAYSISSLGQIYSHKRETVIFPSKNNHGDIRIMLYNDYGRYTRSVSVLVGQAFVPKPDMLCDTAVLLDGNKENVSAANVVWRPRWFAWKYARQLRSAPYPRHYVNLSVMNLDTGREYPSVLSAGMAEGLLFEQIWRSTFSDAVCYPSRHHFEVTQRV